MKNFTLLDKRVTNLEGRSPNRQGKVIGIITHGQTKAEIEAFLEKHGIELFENDLLINNRIINPDGSTNGKPIELKQRNGTPHGFYNDDPKAA